MYLFKLLISYNDDLIGCGTCQQPLDHYKNARLKLTVVTMKHVAMKRMHDLKLPWFTQQRSKRQIPIKKPGNAANRACLSGVRMNDIRLNAFYFPIDLIKRDYIFDR